MPTVTIDKPVTVQETVKVLQDGLGASYHVTAPNSEELKVKHSPVSFATVRLSRDGDATTFSVNGGGLSIARMGNELGIAKKVAETIKAALGEQTGGES